MTRDEGPFDTMRSLVGAAERALDGHPEWLSYVAGEVVRFLPGTLDRLAAAQRERDAARAWARRWKHEAKERLRSQRDSLNDATELLARSTEERDALAARVAALEGALRRTADKLERMLYYEYNDADCDELRDAERALAAPAAPGAGEGEG